MNRSLTRIFALVALVLTAAYGCADQGTPFESVSGPEIRVGGPFLSLSPVERTVRVLERSTPLAVDLVTSRVIGPKGGVIVMPEAGLTLSVPAGAVHSATRIAVRAHAGTMVAYSFEPHGTRFSRVLTAYQQLAGTEAEESGASVSARGYFSSPDEINWSSNRASVTEVSLVQQDATQGSIAFYLNHFSGYLVAID